MKVYCIIAKAATEILEAAPARGKGQFILSEQEKKII